MYYLAIILICWPLQISAADDVMAALKGAQEFLKRDNFNVERCFTISSQKGPVEFLPEWEHNTLIKSFSELDTRQTPLEICTDPCCYRIVLFVNTFQEIDPTWVHHRLYVVISFNETENPLDLDTYQDNLVLFHKVGRYFGVYYKYRGQMKFLSIWDGEKFSHDVRRDYRGEKLRIGSGILPLFTSVITLPNGTVVEGDGLENVFFRAITKAGGFEMQYFDALPYDITYWGQPFPNGTHSGLLHMLLDINLVDVTSLQHMCAYAMHRHLQCSHAYDYDGINFALKLPPPLASWMGLLTPYNVDAWLGIAGLLIVTTIVLGTCHKLSLGGKTDWTLHFLDALHPICGRNMAVPGFDAAHLGRGKKILGFELFLIIYSLACVVINTGYEGNLKSHLMAKQYPKPIQTFDELYNQAGSYKELIDLRADGNIVKWLIKANNNKRISRLDEVIEMVPKPEDVNWDDYHLFALEGNIITNAGSNIEYQIKRALTKKDGTTDISIIPENLILNPYSLHLARMNRFNEILNHRVLQWFDAGLFLIHYKWGLYYTKSLPLPEGLDNSENASIWDPLPVDLFRLLFIFEGIGLTAGAIIFILEVLKPKKAKNFNNSMNVMKFQ